MSGEEVPKIKIQREYENLQFRMKIDMAKELPPIFTENLTISLNQLDDPNNIWTFNSFDSDGDGKLSAKNKNGKNEFEDLYTRYFELSQMDLPEENEYSPNVKYLYGKVVNFINRGNKSAIYQNGQEVPVPSTTENSKQGAIGDCWLLAQINALAGVDFGKKALAETLPNIENGPPFTVNINATGETYQFSAQDVQNAIDSGKYSKNNLRVLLLELAFEKHYDSTINNPQQRNSVAGTETVTETKQSSLEGGSGGGEFLMFNDFNNKDIMQLLAGASNLHIQNEWLYDEALILKANNNSAVAIVFSTTTDPKTGEKIEHHECTVESVELDENGAITTVYIINPWNESEVIPKPFDEFKNIVCDMNIAAKDKDIIKQIANIKHKGENPVEIIKNSSGIIAFIQGIIQFEDKQKLVDEFGGVQNLIALATSIGESEFAIEEKLWAKNPTKEEWLKAKGFQSDAFGSSYDEIYSKEVNHREQATPQERLQERKLIGIFATLHSLGFSDKDLEALELDSTILQQLCQKYGYQY